jgi:hypothetical protein
MASVKRSRSRTKSRRSTPAERRDTACPPADPTAQRAAAIAEKMPLVHYPANARMTAWSGWQGLQSKVQRGQSVATDRFGRLRDSHVFVYAGPCCYYHPDCIGDAVIYFSAGAEGDRSGSATPFDSGALEDSPAKLQPFRSKNSTEAQRWRFFTKHEVPLEGWRDEFADWLAFAYDQPDHYMESAPDRYAAGEPDRTRPKYLLENNGTRGRAKFGPGNCGDRRAWTWEVRIEGSLSFEDVAVLHVPFDAFEHANGVADEIEQRAGTRPALKFLAPDVPASIEEFYKESGSILRDLVGT